MLKASNLTFMLVSSFLSSMQRRMGNEVGVKPGSEMLEAYHVAREVNADVALIDRNIQVTLKRTINGMSLREKLSFIWELIKSFVMGDEMEDDLKEEVEILKQDDTIIEVMNFFKQASPGGYNALVHERDAYMAYNLKSMEQNNVVAVVGAGHKEGITTFLNNPDTIPELNTINYVEESRFSILQIILYLIPVIFVVLFILAFVQGINIQGGLINYILFAGTGAFLGSLISGSKIQSAIVAFIVAPITVIHPLLAAGWFSGLVEGKLRHVGWDDMHSLADFDSFKDLWHNQLFRVILVVLGTNLGCTIGVLLTINNVFLPYIHSIFGI
jgi:pheromone shutdown-related protein TraB